MGKKEKQVELELDDYLTRMEAAALLKVSLSFIDRMMMRRQITFYKVRGRVLFLKQDLHKFLEGCRVESA